MSTLPSPDTLPVTPEVIIVEVISLADGLNGTHDLNGVQEIEIIEVFPEPISPVEDAAHAPDAAPVNGVDPTAPLDTHPADGTATNTTAAPDPAADHLQAATDAQTRADADVASGDYHAASQERETAENEAYQGGANDPLHGSTSAELDNAGYQQGLAQQAEHQEGQDASAGNYEAARSDAQDAAQHTGNADFGAGGSDHTGQAKAEANQEDWAVWHQSNADSAAHDADWYAAQGEPGGADTAMQHAHDEQGAAETSGALGNHDSSTAVYDSSAEVAHDTPVDTSHETTAVHDDSAATE